MRVLIFQAATSAVAIAAMTRFSDETRAAGHQVGLRSLQHFRREKEPADRILVALKPAEAAAFKQQGTELVATFQDTDRIIPVQLPEDDEDLVDFDFSSAIGGLDDAKAGMSMDQLKAEAIERGLEVRADSTREELEHSLDLDQHAGAQAGDRRTDRDLMGDGTTGGYVADRIGLRTSNVLPTVNGLDLDRMNDEQLGGVAAALGLTVPKNAKRQTIINKITDTFADKVDAPNGAPKSTAEQPSSDDEGSGETDANADLADADEAALTKIAEDEEIDLGRATSVEGMKAKIVEARAEKANG